MHTEAHIFIDRVKNLHPGYFSKKKVLEVGSLNINGSIRGAFKDCKYVGIDLGEGVGVDVVGAIHEYVHPEEFDVVVSTEMLEHDKHYAKSLIIMLQNLKKGGILIITCAAPGRKEHGTTSSTPGDAPFTNDWYKNISILDFSSILPPHLFNSFNICYARGGVDLQFYGIKS